MDFSSPVGTNGAALVPDLNWAAGQMVAIGVASAQSTAITARAAIVSSDIGVWIAAGVNPTASAGAGSLYIGAGVPVTIALAPGWRIANIQATAAGHLSIIPCSYPG